MGLFDTVKLKANALAADAERAGKVTAAQARTVVLQNDIRKAERELGHSTFSLLENGEIAHPDLEAASARLREARQALKDKEEEIAGLRGQSMAAAEKTAPAPTDQVAAALPDPIADAAPEPTTETPIAEAPPLPETPAPVEAAKDAAEKPAAKRRAPAAKKPAAKTPAVAKAAKKSAKKSATRAQDSGPDA
ncbi:MAG: hypothetical protein NTX16_04555 [Actinobacteria bacterium]|nr:hypothetical protein [Actinomycetota bacterium]